MLCCGTAASILKHCIQSPSSHLLMRVEDILGDMLQVISLRPNAYSPCAQKHCLILNWAAWIFNFQKPIYIVCWLDE